MKTVKKLIRLSPGMAVLGFFLCTACTSCKNPDPTPKQEYSTLMLHLHTNIDTNEAEANMPYRNADGRLISLTYAQMYISNIRAIKTDGTEEAVKDSVILKTIDNEEFIIGKVPSGNYKSVKFDVGVDSPANHKDPSALFSTNPLAPKTPPMWFGNTSKGFIFINMAGMLDSSAAKNGTATYPFSYQIGSDALITTITMPDKNLDAFLPNAGSVVHITIDYGKLFNGIDVKKQNKNATFDDPATAAQIAKNIPSMFRYEQ